MCARVYLAVCICLDRCNDQGDDDQEEEEDVANDCERQRRRVRQQQVLLSVIEAVWREKERQKSERVPNLLLVERKRYKLLKIHCLSARWLFCCF